MVEKVSLLWGGTASSTLSCAQASAWQQFILCGIHPPQSRARLCIGQVEGNHLSEMNDLQKPLGFFSINDSGRNYIFIKQ